MDVLTIGLACIAMGRRRIIGWGEYQHISTIKSEKYGPFWL
jgi:hypothetical protein